MPRSRLELAARVANAQPRRARKWVATFWNWKARTSFGKAKPVPFKDHTPAVWAETEAEARVKLAIWMERTGHALGGLLEIVQG